MIIALKLCSLDESDSSETKAMQWATSFELQLATQRESRIKTEVGVAPVQKAICNQLQT